MHVEVPSDALRHGFVNAPVGTHSSRTIMVSELTMLLDAAPPELDYDDIRALVISDNVCAKATQSGRREVFRRLAELYSFRRNVPIYRAFRWLWQSGADDRPLLAMLLASARDPLLRATAEPVLAAPVAALLTPHDLSQATEESYPGRYSSEIVASIGRHTIASWTQAGHLSGRAQKRRAQACAGPASAALALYFGWLCGSRGIGLFDTFWARLLDAPRALIDQLAFAASQRGWLEYRRIGDVADIRFGAFGDVWVWGDRCHP